MAEDMTAALLDGVMQAADAGMQKLPQEVVISDAGKCRKHVKVTVARTAIDGLIEQQFTKLMLETPAQVPGFRTGKAPRKMIERKFKKEVMSDVKTQVLMASLEQLAEESTLSPLSPPELDPNSVIIPEDGPMVYEFKIEVRPEFDLPSYKNLKIKKPTHTFTDAEIAAESKKILEPFGPIVPKEGDNPTIAMNDMVTFSGKILHGDREVNKFNEVQIKIVKRLALADGVAEDFGKLITGAKVGETRIVPIQLSQDIADEVLRGKTVEAHFTVNDIKVRREVELTEGILENFGVRNADQFEEYVRARLNRQLEYTQRNTARSEVFDALAKNANFDLPEDLLIRQARKALQRRVMEMRSAGMTEQQILGRQRMLEQDVIRSTSASLKEHFVLQKIAESEKLEIEDGEIDAEIENIADRTGESPRKVKARYEREDLLEALATELLERKALETVLATAEYEEYEFNPLKSDEDDIAVADTQSTPV